jgi:phosphoenolpyruvate carboxylase
MCFKDLEIPEYMWDWEGKFVDEAVIDRLFMQYHDFFQKTAIGRDVFLTFRIPNIWIESTHKLPRAFMNIITAENAARKYQFHAPPLFEVILPMTTSADQLTYLQDAFHKITHATEDIFDLKSSLKMIEIIPLFENFESIAESKKILHKYVDYLKKQYDYTPEYLRIFTARSDPAMNAGFLPAKLAAKQAVSLYHEFEKETGIKVFPIVGGGCLPFRGGINPENIPATLEEYAGFSTLTIQSAYRYDYDLPEVKKSIKQLLKGIPANKNKYLKLTQKEYTFINELNQFAAKKFKHTVEKLAETINHVADRMPNHRERVQHIGLFGYSRGEGKVKLPRAIKFTGAFYSLGVPPELIASGAALAFAKTHKQLALIEKLCPYLREDFIHAGHYFNEENLKLLAQQNTAWKSILNEIQEIQSILKIKIGPDKPHHFIHRNYTSNIYHRMVNNEEFAEDVLKASEIRKSLG